jgi:F-box protein 20
LLQIYGTASITSEEDEIMKKEREIIEILEKEEQWRYRNNKTSEEKDIGE